jgi:hypothetical protein
MVQFLKIIFKKLEQKVIGKIKYAVKMSDFAF